MYYLASKVSAITADTYGVAALVPSNVRVHSLLSVVVAYVNISNLNIIALSLVNQYRSIPTP